MSKKDVDRREHAASIAYRIRQMVWRILETDRATVSEDRLGKAQDARQAEQELIDAIDRALR